MSDRTGASGMAVRPGQGPGPVPWWIPVFNPVARFLLGAGVPMASNGLLTVRGRKSGLPRTTPLAIIQAGGRRWIWSPYGDVQWVRNLRAAGTATISERRRRLEVRAIELDQPGRIAFFRDVIGPMARSVRGGVTFIRLVDRVDLHDPAAAAEGRYVFELLPLP